MARSALQRRIENQQQHENQLRESLVRGTANAKAKAREQEVDPLSVGRALAARYKCDVKREPETFNRPLKTRNVPTIRLAYAMHMFGEYKVPRFIQSAFVAAEPRFFGGSLVGVKKEDEMMELFLCVRSGRSVHKEITGLWLSRKESHVFLQSPEDLTIDQAYVFAAASSEAPRGLALRIARSKLTETVKRDHRVWREAIRFFARQNLPREHIGNITDYLRAKLTDDPNYSLKGRTLASLMRAHEEWVRDLNRTKLMGSYSWEGVPVADAEFETHGRNKAIHRWKFIQILNTKDLSREGSAMRHCVTSYAHSCRAGLIGIFTVRYREGGPLHAEDIPFRKCLTIEVSKDGDVRQIRGYANRMPENFEMDAVKVWMGDNGLTKSRYYY